MGAGIDPKTGRWDWSIGRIAWIDAETTDVWDHDSPPLLLELAVIVTNAALEELGRCSVVIEYPDPEVPRSAASDFVKDMHSKSGLWDALYSEKSITPLHTAEAELCQLLRDTATSRGELDTRPVVWGGFSPSALDRPVVRLYMPTFYSMIHYRTIDVSSVKLTALNYFGVRLDRDDPAHRAEQDTEDTIAAFGRITALISKKTRRREKTKPAVRVK